MPLATNLQPDPERKPKEFTELDSLKALNEVLRRADPSKLAEILSGESSVRKPSGWSTLTNAPYFKERFALEVKCLFDEMIAEVRNGEFSDRLIKYSDSQLSPNSLYIKINQATLYLINCLDTEGLYKRFREMITISRHRGIGIRLSYHRDIVSPSSVNPMVVEKVMPAKEQRITVNEKIEKFLTESKPGDVLYIDRLALSDEDKQEIYASLVSLQEFIFKFTDTTLTLRRLTDEEIRKLG